MSSRITLPVGFLSSDDLHDGRGDYLLLQYYPLKPYRSVLNQQFNIQQLYALPSLYCLFCIYLRTNSDLCHLLHKLIGFYNRFNTLQHGGHYMYHQFIIQQLYILPTLYIFVLFISPNKQQLVPISA